MNGTDAVAPLSVATDDLTLTVADVSMPIRSTGDRLFVEVPTLRHALSVARSVSADAGRPSRFLAATDLTTELRVRGRTVVVLGAAARPGWLARELGVAPAEVRVGGALTAVGDGAGAAVGRLAAAFR